MPERPARHPSGLGIDLSRWHLDVRRILISVHGRRIRAAGLDVEDVLSEVYRRILVANDGEHPYDPSRASLSRYCAVQGMSAIRNMLEKERRRSRWETTGMHDAEGIERDVASLDLEDDSTFVTDAALDLATSDAEERALRLLAAGVSDAEIRETTGEDPGEIRDWLRLEVLGETPSSIDLLREWWG